MENKGDAEDDEEEEEEIPEDLKDLDPEVRTRAIIMRSLWMMISGTCVVLIFSDPMVDVLNEFATLSNIDSF